MWRAAGSDLLGPHEYLYPICGCLYCLTLHPTHWLAGWRYAMHEGRWGRWKAHYSYFNEHNQHTLIDLRRPLTLLCS